MNLDEFGGNSASWISAHDTTDEEFSMSAVLHVKSGVRSYHLYKHECNSSTGGVFKFGHYHHVRCNVWFIVSEKIVGHLPWESWKTIIVIKLAESTDIGADAAVDEIEIGMYAGSTDVDAGGAEVDAVGADMDAGVLLRKGITDRGVGHFHGWPTGLFFSILVFFLEGVFHRSMAS